MELPQAPSPARGHPVKEADKLTFCDVVSVALAFTPDFLCEHLLEAVAKSAGLLRGVPGALDELDHVGVRIRTLN